MTQIIPAKTTQSAAIAFGGAGIQDEVTVERIIVAEHVNAVIARPLDAVVAHGHAVARVGSVSIHLAADAIAVFGTHTAAARRAASPSLPDLDFLISAMSRMTLSWMSDWRAYELMPM